MADKSPTSVKIGGADAAIIAESDLFQLSCCVYGCTSNCCTKSAPIILNPYEIALICREGRINCEDLLDIVETDRAKGFPLVMLPRDPSCYFWTGRGCRIYGARPLACRLFPLGRVFDNGRSRIVLPELNVCSGLAPAPSTNTVADYLFAQDTSTLVEMADRWIEFVNDVVLLQFPDKPVTSVAFHMLVYSPDTPPAVGHSDDMLALEDRFIMRLATARNQLPQFLLRQKK